MEDIPSLTKPDTATSPAAVTRPPPPSTTSITPPSSALSPVVMGPIPYGTVRRGPTFLTSSAPPPLPSPSRPHSPPAPPRPIVLALGSRTLRFGTSDDFAPQSTAFAIAYHTRTSSLSPPPSSPPSSPSDWSDAARLSFERLHADVARRRVKPPPKPKFFDEFDAVPVYEEGGATTRVDLPVDDTAWTDVQEEPSYVVGDAALAIHPDAPYTPVFFPLQMGRFNVQPSSTPSPSSFPPFTTPNRSYTAALSAIELILYDVLTTRLHIPPHTLPSLSLVLSLPSTLTPRETSDLSHLLLSHLRVKEVALHSEAVMAAFGSGLASACVVDVGAQVTRVSCVEDGVVVGGSEVSAAYGAEDVGELLWEWMRVHDHHMPCPHIRPRRSFWHWQQLQRAKQKVLNCTQRDYPYQWLELRELRKEGGVRLYRMNVSSAAVLAPRALFKPELFRGWGEGEGRRLWGCGAVVDVMMDDIVRGSVFYAFTKEYEERKRGGKGDRPRRDVWEQVRRQQVEAVEGGGGGGGAGPSAVVGKDVGGVVGGVVGEGGEEKKEEVVLVEKVDGRRRKRRKEADVLFPLPTTNPATTSRSPSPPPPPSFSPASPPLPSLTQLVAASLNAVPSLPTRRRLATSILLTGGFCAVPHLVEYVGERLAVGLPGLMGGTLTGGRGVGEEVLCQLGSKLVDVGCEGWKGAAVVAGIRVEGVGTGGKDKWITREEWQRNPGRCMREKMPFVVQ